ncbi:S8 family serine peptidase [Actinomadura sp. DC4]|uniref:S8 family peptidase n=1 Tax=Actinomadura sp. DC4 TaxID=3055069 RepID=UPI0025B18711|nr:S8 family serine peptidase [Actinomadura sp. DC4]MDN3353946.1 S8 family serine peptidase [Actinomadura sp. DC4]
MSRSRAGAALALAGLVIAGLPAVASAAAPASPPKLAPGRSWTVTLLTGDVVKVNTQSGRPPLVSVRPGAGRRSVIFRKDIRPDGDVRVVPLDVAAKIGRVYDPALFDVTTLIKDGDDDAHRADLPLIVQNGTGVRALAAGRTLSSIGAVAVRQPKKQALAPKTMTQAGVRHVWLDRRVHVQALDHNLDQIGAPAAWKAGATGKGVKVAVLDTGVDATHPDLKGRIAEQKNFSESADTVDRYGHGTHVAATIAGTGAAANGERRGVAPDADLLIGKVLDDNGYGSESGVITGMEWAAAKAPVVSMSLGGFSDDPANDPVTKAVDDLTAADGTLFVIAAGNDGEPDSIESPGFAASALTVGAVDAQDKVASFSSRGGRVLKPEIAAPGVDVVAARAAGTSMGHIIDANYTSASGTSMATPHVAGAAAALLQEHPSWDPARLKAALVSTADAVPGTVYDVGSGRLDVGAAAIATVTGDQATAAFGSIPHGSTAPLTKRLTWTNAGKSPVTLRLAATLADSHGTAAAALSLPATVTVPAGGSAGADLSLDPRRLTTGGAWSGVVTARADGVALRTPVGAYAEPETHTLTMKATALPGTPDGAMSGWVSVVDLDDYTLFSSDVSLDADGTARLTVPSGRYLVLGEIDDTTAGAERAALAGSAELTVNADVTLPLDASHARPLRLSAPGMSVDPGSATGLQVERTLGEDTWAASVFSFDGSPDVYTVPIAAPRTGAMRVYAYTRLTDGGATVDDILHDLGPSVPASVDYQVDPKSLARVDQRFGTINGDVKDPVGEVRYGLDPAGFLVSEGISDVTGGSTRTDHVSAEPGLQWAEEAVLPNLGRGLWVTELPVRRYTPGSTQTDEWVRQPFRPGPYSATGVSPSECAPGASTRSRGNIHVELVDLQDLPDGFDCLTGMPEWDAVSSRTMRLYAGDTLEGTTTTPYGDFGVPATAGTYRLRYDLDASAALPVSTKTSTSWTFHSDPVEERLPLLLVDYRLPLDLLNHPNGDTATFSVSRVAGAATAKATGLQLWTSLDDGTTWRPASVSGTDGKYSAKLPPAGKGQAVSLRVRATDAGGGVIDQTLIRAYFGA